MHTITTTRHRRSIASFTRSRSASGRVARAGRSAMRAKTVAPPATTAGTMCIQRRTSARVFIAADLLSRHAAAGPGHRDRVAPRRDDGAVADLLRIAEVEAAFRRGHGDR